MKKNVLILMSLINSFSFIIAQDHYTINSLVPTETISKVEIETRTNHTIVPFELLGGLIIVETQINGQPSSCIFDTGAPSIVINKDIELLTTSDDEIRGVTGTMKMRSSIVKDFGMGKLKRQNIDALEVDISHLEKLKQREIEGIVGINVYSQEEVLINYEKSEIEFLPRKHKNKLDGKELITSMPFSMENQLPIIKIRIGKRTYYFGVDTGAELNIIDEHCFIKIKSKHVKVDGERLLTSVDEVEQAFPAILVDQVKIKKQSFAGQEFVIMDLKTFNQNLDIQLDGILGYPFLKDQLVSFDFRRSRLNFWKAKVGEGEIAQR